MLCPSKHTKTFLNLPVCGKYNYGFTRYLIYNLRTSIKTSIYYAKALQKCQTKGTVIYIYILPLGN